MCPRTRKPRQHQKLSRLLFGLCFFTSVSLGSHVFSQETQQEHPLIPALRLARQSQKVLDQVNDYEATLIKRERIDGNLIGQRIAMKLRKSPFSVYMKYERPNAGRQILYVEGQNQNQLLAREASGLTSLIGTVSLPIDSPQVMAENRHPITDVGMHRMIEMVIEQWELESKYGEIDVQFYPQAKMGNAECEVIETTHPRPRRQFKYHLSRVFIEKQSRLPIRIENYGFPQQANTPAPLLEEYTYLNVRTNVNLTAADFDRANRNYSFR